jgi:hypothetical protein
LIDREHANFFFTLPACAICGVLCISLPIPIIVNNFNKFYEKAKIEEEILAKKKKSSWEDAKRGSFMITIFFQLLWSHSQRIMHKKNLKGITSA